MARWKLTSPHYINLTQTAQWEYIEDGYGKGPIRRRFDVPTYLDPADPKSWTKTWGPNGLQEGEIILCLPNRGLPGDLEFNGDPTPQMVPMDAEAEEITATFTNRWRYKPDIEAEGYNQSLVNKISEDARAAEAAAKTVQVEGLSELVAAIAQLVAQSPSKRL